MQNAIEYEIITKNNIQYPTGKKNYENFDTRHLLLHVITKQPTFSKFMDFMAESMDFTTPAIDPVTC